MKKILIMLSVILLSHTTLSQSRKVVIDRCINKSEIYGPTGMICSNLNKTKWFTMTPVYQLDGDRLSCDGLWVIRMDIGNLSKEDQIFLVFTDGTKLRLESGIELTSEKSIYFKLTDLEFTILKSKELQSARYINGNDFCSFQYNMTGDEKTYFTNLLTNYYIRDVYCD